MYGNHGWGGVNPPTVVYLEGVKPPSPKILMTTGAVNPPPPSAMHTKVDIRAKVHYFQELHNK